jgi:N-acetylneuraminic acid mutarotase
MSRREGILVGAIALCLLALAVLVLEQSADAGPGWERASSMSQRRSYLAAAELDGMIYAAGGMVGETGRPLATFARYDPSADRWQVLPRLPVATRAAAATALGGRVYVVGGTTATGNTAATWAYDPRGQRWRRLAPMPAPRFNHGVVALGDRLYVLGGYAGGREHRDVLSYDPDVGGWRRVSSLPRPVHAFGAIAFDDELWVIGGRRGERVLREVWILDPDSRRWRRGPSMPRGMELLGVATRGDEIHAVWESVYQIYDAGQERWRKGPSPVVTRHALEAFIVDETLYAIGGCTTALQDSPIVERLMLD